MRTPQGAFAIYSRKSKFTGKGESIGNQIELCRDYLRSQYGADAAAQAVVYEDEGFSGGNLNRPAFKEMMKAARAEKLQAIVVYRLDRISRNISDFSALIEELSRLGVAFISIREQFDTGTPMGRAMMYIASVFSQLERETIAERIRDNMHELAKTGRWLGGTTPTGYTSESVQSVTVDGKAHRACKLRLVPDEAETVRKIYELYLATDSLTLTEADLLRLGITTKRGRSFTRFSIKNILQNPVYVMATPEVRDHFIALGSEVFSPPEAFDGVHGILAYNRTDQEKGQNTVYLPPTEWIVTVAAHPGLIPAAQWLQVQRSLERNKTRAYHKPRRNEAILTGLLYCRCGSRMYPKLTKRKTADGKPFYTYLCKLKERSRHALCDVKNVNGNVLDAAVIEQIGRLTEDGSAFMAALEKSKQFYTGDRKPYEDTLTALRAEREAVEGKITALVDSLAEAGAGARGAITARIEALQAESAALALRIEEAEGMTDRRLLTDSEFDVLSSLLASFRTGIADMTVEQRRAAVRTVVRKVVWDGERAHMVLFGAGDGDIEYPDFPSPTEEDEKSPAAQAEIDAAGSDLPEKARWGADSE